MYPGAYEPPKAAKEHISYIIHVRVVTSNINRAAKATKTLPNMVLTARPLSTQAMTTTLSITVLLSKRVDFGLNHINFIPISSATLVQKM